MWPRPHPHKRDSSKPLAKLQCRRKLRQKATTLKSRWVHYCTRHCAYCNKIRPTVGIPGSPFNFDNNGRLAVHWPIDSSVQKFVLQSVLPTLFHSAYYSTQSDHTEEHRRYDTLWHEYYWPNMSKVLYNTVRHYHDHPRIGTNFKYQCQLGLFPPSCRLYLSQLTSLTHYSGPSPATTLL